MTKYISQKGPSRCSTWHHDPNCTRMKLDSRELTETGEAYHDLKPCWNCVDGVERPTHSEQNLKYQEILNQ